MLQHAAVRTLVLTIFTFNTTYGAAWSVLVLYATRRLGLGEVGFGLVTTAIAVGGLVGTASYGWITRRVSLGDLMRVGLVIETLTHGALALTTSPWVAMPVFVVFGAHAFVWGTTSVTVRQRAVPLALQGRMGSVHLVGVYGGLVLGSALGGALAQRAGVTAPFWFAFAGSAVFVVLIWRQLGHVAHADERPERSRRRGRALITQPVSVPAASARSAAPRSRSPWPGADAAGRMASWRSSGTTPSRARCRRRWTRSWCCAGSPRAR